MVYKTISEDDVRNAETYIPIGKKAEFVEHIGDNRCFQVLSISYGDEAMPPMYREDHELKSRYMLTAFLKMYLKKDVETLEDDEWLMSRDEYDSWSSGHIMNVIERYKSNKDLRDKIYNMLSDYKDLEKRVNLELYGRLNVMNDVLLRVIQKLGEKITPESLTQLTDSFKETEQQLMSELQRRQAILDGTSEELKD